MNPKVQETLNNLRPPVERLFKNYRYCRDEASRYNAEANNNLYTTPNQRVNSTWDVKDTTSSLSVLVKQSEENLTVEKYTVLSYTNLQFSKVPHYCNSSIDDPEVEKPVIKVTVIPNNTSATRKKRSCPKRIESSVSNQESSVKSENVYIVIKNRKHEKVYEVKGTGSAEFSKSNYKRRLKHEEISVKQNVQQLLKSLNMDTKKKKGRRKRLSGEDEEEFDDERFEKYSGTGRCTCSRQIGSYDIFANTMAPAQMEQSVKRHLKSLHEKKMRNLEKIQLVNEEMPSEEEAFEKLTYDCKCQPFSADTGCHPSKKGQVKITGKLGLNHDDQYVLQCDASIDDQPFETMYQTRRISTTPSDSPYSRYCECPQDRLNERSISNNYQPKFKARNHKDSTVQVDLCPATPAIKSILCPAMQSTSYRSQETQCKPANFNQVCFSNIDKLKIYANKDETLQCDCANSDNMILKPAQREGDIGASNFTNPLVIISVYPKPEGTHSREASPSRATHNAKPAVDKQTARRGNPLKPKTEKKAIKRNDRSPTKPEVITGTALKTVKSPIRNPVKIQKVAAKTERSENVVSKSEKVRPRSRSSSPPSSPTRQKVDTKFVENKTIKIKKEVNRVKSPDRNANSQFGKATQQKVITQQAEMGSTSKQIKMSHQRDTKFSSEGTKAKHPTYKKLTLDTSDESLQELTDIPKSSKGVNTEVTLSKKAIVDSFKRACECVIDGRSTWDGHASQKHQSEWAEGITNASNVAVSIDGENELYDGLFRNSTRVSDVQVRHIDTDLSLKNLLYNTDEGTPRKRSDSYAYNTLNQSNHAEIPRVSGLVVRDSIELFHRRTDESDSELVVTEQMSVTAHDVFSKGINKSSVTPSKHYIGDSCPVTYPIERDREIRELLGIERSKVPTVSPMSSVEGSLPSRIPTPVGTSSNTPAITPVETPSTSAPTYKEVLQWFPAGLQYSSCDKRPKNAHASVREIAGIAPKYDIMCRICNKVNSTKNCKHEKAKCHYEVYQTNVYTKQTYRPFEVYPLKTCNLHSFCCCPDSAVQLSRKTVDGNINHPNDFPSRERKKSCDPVAPEALIEHIPPEKLLRKKRPDLTRPRCCDKKECKKSSSDCSDFSTNSSNTRLLKKKMKRDKKEKKEKQKEEKKQRKAIKDLKRRKKKSKCKCIAKLKKVNDKCCSTSLHQIYNPRLLKCQGTTTTPIVPKPKEDHNLRTLQKTKSPPPKKYDYRKQKNTCDKFQCCTCDKPIIPKHFPLAKEAEMDCVEEPIQEKEEEQCIVDQGESTTTENKEEYKIIDFPRQSANVEHQVENKPEERKVSKLKDICCSTPPDPNYNLKLIPCQGSSTNRIVTKRVANVKTVPRLQSRSSKKYRDIELKNASDNICSCTRKRPIIQNELALNEELTINCVKEPVQEKEEQCIYYQRERTISECQEENKPDENKFSKHNDESYSVPADLIYNPRLFKYHGYATNTIVPKTVPRLQSRLSNKYGDRNLKNTSDKVSCCTCNKPIIQNQVSLIKATEINHVEEHVQEKLEENKFRKFNDKSVWTSTDLINDPKSLKHQGITTNIIFPQRVSSVKTVRKLKSKPSKRIGASNLKNTCDKVTCCTCKKLNIRNQFALPEEHEMNRVEEPVQKEDESIDHQTERTIFKNNEINGSVDYPRQSKHYERQEENEPEIFENKGKNRSVDYPRRSIHYERQEENGPEVSENKERNKSIDHPRRSKHYERQEENGPEVFENKEKNRSVDYPRRSKHYERQEENGLEVSENKERNKSIDHPRRSKHYERQEENEPNIVENKEGNRSADYPRRSKHYEPQEENGLEIFENKERNRSIDYPRRIKHYERQEGNKPEENKPKGNEHEQNSFPRQSTVFESEDDKHHGQQSVDEAQPNYQQLILNRNINIYLQIEKFHKQKPILLSKKQYEKVKKVLDVKVTHSRIWKGRHAHHCCSCSVGEIRKKDGENEFNNPMHANVCTLNRAEQASQKTSWLMTKNETAQKVCKMTTEQMESAAESPKQSLIQQIYQDADPGTIRNKIKELTSIKQNTKKTVPEPRRDTQNVINCVKEGGKNNNSYNLKCAQCGRKNVQVSNVSSFKKNELKERYEAPRYYIDNDKFCNICRMVHGLEGETIYPIQKLKSSTRRAASSAEIYYANINTEKRVTFSSSYLDGNVVRQASSHLLLRKHSSNSLYTLFKGCRRKCPTPNLGTSIDSLSSENVTWKAYKVNPVEVKNRKPFLKRLMSCLIMRSKTSDVRFGRLIPKVASMNSSIDSYHINTSLNGIDLSSSIYDTSASYFTNHTILPISGFKMKRGGFLSSVKGFLSNNRKT